MMIHLIKFLSIAFIAISSGYALGYVGEMDPRERRELLIGLACFALIFIIFAIVGGWDYALLTK